MHTLQGLSLLTGTLLCAAALTAEEAATPAATAPASTPPVSAAAAVPGQAEPAADARSTAVALNYCRASFHRLRRNPSKRVLLEEQSKILNNLNLNGIADQEVVTLYTAVLDEVGRERIADRERHVINQGYRRAVRQEALSRAFIIGSEIGTAQYTSAIRTGCSSWWDYRSMGLNRDLDLWKVDKTRMLEVVDKSSKCLDTFWKLAQRKNIPDKWLVREDDLDRLDTAVAETDAEKRLRVLQRMSDFMECYPPYLYHVARTQQSLGQLFAAAETYEKLARLGAGHFRQDEMLASGMANRAAIQAYLGQPGAAETARQALAYSNDVWQANLVCAGVLAQHGHAPEAEDAVLRNLDVDLERTQSTTCLVSLYCSTRNEQKLIARLSEPAVVTELPMAVLLKSAATLGTAKLPPAARRQIVASLHGFEQRQFGRNEVVLIAAPNWELDRARTVLRCDGTDFLEPETADAGRATQLQFVAVNDLEEVWSPYGQQPKLQLEIQYVDSPAVRLSLQRVPWSDELAENGERGGNAEAFGQELRTLFTGRRRSGFRITECEFGEEKLALWTAAPRGRATPAVYEQVRPVEPTATRSVTKPESKPAPSNVASPPKKPLAPGPAPAVSPPSAAASPVAPAPRPRLPGSRPLVVPTGIEPVEGDVLD